MSSSTIRRSLVGLCAAGLATLTAVLPGVATTAGATTTADAAAPTALTSELGPDNPFMAPGDVGAMHSDSYSAGTARA